MNETRNNNSVINLINIIRQSNQLKKNQVYSSVNWIQL